VLKQKFLSLISPLLQNALVQLDQSANSLSEGLSKGTMAKSALEGINQALYRAEQSLLTEQGLPRRPWYKHTLYAPGFYTGYGVKTMPGIREAIEQRDWKEAQQQINIAANAIGKLAEHLKAASMRAK
jgi:N-acetylated-alpha-linked acidic dipeptidase